MSLSELTLGKIVQRFLLYIGIALAVLVVFAVAIVLSKGTTVSAEWLGLVVYTSGLFWVTIRQSREYWRRPSFWLAIAGLLVVHLLAFVAILRAYPDGT
jgi:apolipoprotein N-acyltransferase